MNEVTFSWFMKYMHNQFKNDPLITKTWEEVAPLAYLKLGNPSVRNPYVGY